MDPVSFGRRRLLAGCVGIGAAALGGCTLSDPRIETPSRGASSMSNPSSRATPTGPPTESFVGAARGAALEQRMAAGAAGLVSAHRKALGHRRRLIDAVRDNHLAHEAALRSADPTARPTTGPPPPPAPVPSPNSSLRSGLAALARAETGAAAQHRERAVSATGFSALLWTSLGVCATSQARAVSSGDPVEIAPLSPPRPLPQLSDVEAIAQLVRQLHAIIYGYQLAIGQLKVGSPRHDQAVQRLQAHRVLRDALVERLIDASAKVPVAEPAYVPTVRPRNPTTSGRLLRDMETALAPFCGLWLAATGSAADRAQAYDALADTVATAMAWGAPLLRWPGWVR